MLDVWFNFEQLNDVIFCCIVLFIESHSKKITLENILSKMIIHGTKNRQLDHSLNIIFIEIEKRRRKVFFFWKINRRKLASNRNTFSKLFSFRKQREFSNFRIPLRCFYYYLELSLGSKCLYFLQVSLYLFSFIFSYYFLAVL